MPADPWTFQLNALVPLSSNNWILLPIKYPKYPSNYPFKSAKSGKKYAKSS